MKLTDEIVKALSETISDGYESVSEFARLTDVSARTVTKYLRRETESIKDETWSKLYPLIKPHLKKKVKSKMSNAKPIELTTDERVLVDAFNDLPPEVKKQKLLELVAMARKFNSERENGHKEE